MLKKGLGSNQPPRQTSSTPLAERSGNHTGMARCPHTVVSLAKCKMSLRTRKVLNTQTWYYSWISYCRWISKTLLMTWTLYTMEVIQILWVQRYKNLTCKSYPSAQCSRYNYRVDTYHKQRVWWNAKSQYNTVVTSLHWSFEYSIFNLPNEPLWNKTEICCVICKYQWILN